MKTDVYRLEKISETGHQLLKAIDEQRIDATSVNADIKQQWMVSTPLYNIGEHVNCLSNRFVAQHPEQPWSSISGLRYRLVHDYEGTNWKLIGFVLENDIKPFILAVDEILEKEYTGAADGSDRRHA